jgi:ABC-type multidrug transport system fused ATPase/permease subunit
MNPNWHLLVKYLRPYWRKVTLLTLLILASIGLQLAAPQVIRRFLDLAQAGVAVPLLTATAALFFVITIVQKALTLLSTYASVDLGWAATNRLRVDLAEHVLRLDMGFHKLRPPGELIERIDGDVGNLAEYFSQLVVQVLGNGLLALGILLLLWRENWLAGLIGFLYAALVFIFLRAIQERVVTIWRDISRSFADLYSFVEERLIGKEDIRANGGEAYVMGRLFHLLNQVRSLRIRGEVLSSLTFIAGFLLYTLALLLTLALGATLYLRGQMTIGTVFLLMAYVGLLESPLNTIRRQIADLQRALASIGRIHELLQLQPQVQEQAITVLPDQAPAVCFNHVTFGYKDGPVTDLSVNGSQLPVTSYQLPVTSDQDANHQATVLPDITFTLDPGRVLGILGRTGSGKTTLTRLLFRLYDVDQGAILLNGVDVRHVTLADLRQYVGMVTQDVQLFAATVRDNLTLFRNYGPAERHISDDHILAAIEMLGLGNWFRALPDGLDTLLTSGGQGLSAGEAQLLALTRVFLRDPKLIILDEASSRLDPATEQLLERAIDRLMHNRTGMIIAHRLSTVQRADDVLILENGRIAEWGQRAVLANDPRSRFYNLLQTGLAEVLV